MPPCAPTWWLIGGGIIGVSTALSLSEKGLSVALCEKGSIGAEQSNRNWGWCRTMGPARSQDHPGDAPIVDAAPFRFERFAGET